MYREEQYESGDALSLARLFAQRFDCWIRTRQGMKVLRAADASKG
jgi:hypothetical protein